MEKISRRDLLRAGMRGLALLVIGGGVGSLAFRRGNKSGDVWQIDPAKCTQCGKCATSCVLAPSAVKCVHSFKVCGYCKLCFGYFESESIPENLAGTGAEYQRCPTNAISRRFIEGPYYEYKINDKKCIGCGVCVRGCTAYGNGSFQLQISHDICKNCNICNIAKICPSQAIRRVSASSPYMIKGRQG